jgi:hypothetical protein
MHWLTSSIRDAQDEDGHVVAGAVLLKLQDGALYAAGEGVSVEAG